MLLLNMKVERTSLLKAHLNIVNLKKKLYREDFSSRHEHAAMKISQAGFALGPFHTPVGTPTTEIGPEILLTWNVNFTHKPSQ